MEHTSLALFGHSLPSLLRFQNFPRYPTGHYLSGSPKVGLLDGASSPASGYLFTNQQHSNSTILLPFILSRIIININDFI